jgi:peptidoglycan/xylan/chitin deacetylase (PgdA/CDA1 family)
MTRLFIRLDDAGAYMNHDNWIRAIALLDKYNICSTIAVIPNCQDAKLMSYGAVENWKDFIKEWSNNHVLALHGYNHVYEYDGLSNVRHKHKSEFAGAPQHVQENKIKRGLLLFQELGIDVQHFVAPGHSFDDTTVKIVSSFGLIVYDGFYPRAVKINGVSYFPLHFASLKNNLFGYSICLHPNTMTDEDFKNFEFFLEENINRIGDIRDVEYYKAGILDVLVHFLLNIIFKIKYFVRDINF